MACQLMRGIDLICARGVMVLIAASKQTPELAQSRNAMNAFKHYSTGEAYAISEPGPQTSSQGLVG